MWSSQTGRPQWPPAPCVEEEATSPAREVDGLSKIGDRPGVEGFCQRGTVDQYPVLASPHTVLPPSVSPTSLSSYPPGLGNVFSDDNSSWPRTPPPPYPEPVIDVADSQSLIDMPTPKPPNFHYHHDPKKWDNNGCCWAFARHPTIEECVNPHCLSELGLPTVATDDYEPRHEHTRSTHRTHSTSRARSEVRHGHTREAPRTHRETSHENAPRGHDKVPTSHPTQQPSLARSNSTKSTSKHPKRAPSQRDPQKTSRDHEHRDEDRKKHTHDTPRTSRESRHDEHAPRAHDKVPTSHPAQQPSLARSNSTKSTSKHAQTAPSQGDTHRTSRDRENRHEVKFEHSREPSRTSREAYHDNAPRTHEKNVASHPQQQPSLARSNSTKSTSKATQTGSSLCDTQRISRDRENRHEAKIEHSREHPRTSRDAYHENAYPRGRDKEPASDVPRTPSPARSHSTRTAANHSQTAPSRSNPPPREQRPYNLSSQDCKNLESTTPASHERSTHYAPPPAPEVPPTSQPRARPDADTRTLAERLDEKLRLRQELRELSSDSDSSATRRKRSSRSNRSEGASHASDGEGSRSSRRPPRPVSPENWDLDPEPGSTGHRQGPLHQERQEAPSPEKPRGRAATTSDVPSFRLRSALRDPSKAKSMSSDEASPSRNVKFQEKMPHRYEPTDGLCLGHCPRTHHVVGADDWYTFEGLEHLRICPSCKNQIHGSRFKAKLIPAPKSSRKATRCSFADAWVRVAWTQIIHKKHETLEILYQITRPPPGTYACLGRAVVERETWHRVINPDTGLPLSNFHVCADCVRNIRILMPSHRDTFVPVPALEGAICAFFTTSPRFTTYLDLLDGAAKRTEPSRRPDLTDFISYARRKSVLRHCLRDRSIKCTWYYMSSLPELTACEDCFDDVVWPLAKARQPIVPDFGTEMRHLPIDGPRLASCQLYSPRMRARFREAVAANDFAALKDVVLKRFEAERRYNDRREELDAAEKRGYRVGPEVIKAIEEWKRWE